MLAPLSNNNIVLRSHLRNCLKASLPQIVFHLGESCPRALLPSGDYAPRLGSLEW
jgi:hypothetical protein